MCGWALIGLLELCMGTVGTLAICDRVFFEVYRFVWWWRLIRALQVVFVFAEGSD